MISDIYNKKNKPFPFHIKTSKDAVDLFPSGTRRKQRFDSKFKDLQEISAPEEISFEEPVEINKISNINYEELDEYKTSEIDTEKTSILKDKKTANQIIKERSEASKPITREIFDEVSEAEEIEEAEEIDEVLEESEVEELEELDEAEKIEELQNVDVEKNDMDFLIDNIDKDKQTIDYPGKIDVNGIDKSLSETVPVLENESIKEEKKGEMFGVNRVEVFYNIDKQIYSSRSSATMGKSKMKGIKKGLFLPSTVAIISFSLLLIGSLLLSIYFNATSTSTLEDNVIKDDSILAKIAKQKEEEAKLAGQKLEEERKKLNKERKRMEATINEELLKKEAEIENKFKQRLKEISSKTTSKEELEKLKKQIELERQKSLDIARKEKDEKIDEQNQVLEEKNQKLGEAMENLKKESQNYENELERIRQEFEQRRKEEERKTELATFRLQRIKENEDQIKNFNSTVYQFITKAMSYFQKGNKDSAIKNLNEVLKFYNSNQEFIILNDELKKKMNTDIFFVETIRGLIEDSKGSLDYNKEYAKIINKFKKVTDYYKKAESLYNEKNFSRSGKEYAKVLEEFDEINLSYKKIKDVETQIQNEKALVLYNQALGNIKNEKYDIALSRLSTVIKEAPLSDYANSALSQIVRISESASFSKDKARDNEKAKQLYIKAENFEKRDKIDDALLLYQTIITDYSGSDYTKPAFAKTQTLSSILKGKDMQSYDNTLKERFQTAYESYKDAQKKGDIENARKYYFDALREAFDIYTNNSISDFKEVEDRYIQSLLKEKEGSAQEELIVQYEQELDSLKKDLVDFEKEKKSLTAKYTALEKSSTLTSKQRKEMIENYEIQLVEKDSEIEKYRNYIEEKEREISKEESEKIISEYENKLQAEKEKAETLKKQLFEYYKKDNELTAEREKTSSLITQIDELQNKYENLDKKYNDKTISEEEKRNMEKELEIIFEEKFRKEKEKELQLERQKIKEEFEEELNKMKKYISTLNLELTKKQPTSKITSFGNQLFGRITDIVNNSLAFQFISPDAMSMTSLKKDDKVQILRMEKTESGRKEIVIGYMLITSVSQGSQYGRGKLVSYRKGYSVRIGDLLKN